VIARRAVLLLLAGLRPALGDERADFIDVLSRLAAALAATDVAEFFRYIDQSFPERESFRARVAGLLDAAEVTSSVVVARAADGEAEVDWYMELKGRSPAGPSERRRQTLRVRMNQGKRITLIEPASFFALQTAASPNRG
jgi:hypothetical protein